MQGTSQQVMVPELANWMAKGGAPVSLVLRANGFLFVSGIPPVDPVTGTFTVQSIEAQTKRVMDNIALCLAAGGSSFDRVVRTTVYVTNAAYFAVINRIYGAYFPGPPPTRTFVVVGSWPAPFDIEIECTALA